MELKFESIIVQNFVYTPYILNTLHQNKYILRIPLFFLDILCKVYLKCEEITDTVGSCTGIELGGREKWEGDKCFFLPPMSSGWRSENALIHGQASQEPGKGNAGMTTSASWRSQSFDWQVGWLCVRGIPFPTAESKLVNGLSLSFPPQKFPTLNFSGC